MTKKRFQRSFVHVNCVKKLLLIMKLTTLILFLISMQIEAIGYSQDSSLKLDFQTGTISDLIQAIETQSNFRIFYKTDQVNVHKNVYLSVTDGSIAELLSDALKNSDITYQVLDRLIVLTNTSVDKQQVRVSGIITDASTGEPLPGVNILIEGTQQGVITDGNGQYSIQVSSASTVLMFSYIGYNSERVEVAGRTVIDIGLTPDIKSLEEVVVIGYGSRTKRDVTTAISSVGAKAIEKEISMSPEMAMQGRMTGVQVSGNSGNPMSRPTIRIRGVNTWGVSSPLYVVDGIPVTEFGSGIEGLEDGRAADVRGPLNIMSMIDPNDIESISVLKDASSAAIYGVRAANGVILITTKKGRGDKPSVEFSTRFGIQNLTQKIDVMNTTQYVQHVQNVYASDPTIAVDPINEGLFDPNDARYLGNAPTYDWQKAIKNKNAPTQDYSLRMSGGTAKTDYFVSASYSQTEGALKYNKLERYSGSIKINTQANKWLKMGLNYRLTSAKGRDNDFLVTFWQAAQTAPWQPIYDNEGLGGYAAVVTGFEPNGTYNNRQLYGTGTRVNVLGMLDQNDTEFKSVRNMGTAYIEIEPVKTLKIKGQFSMDVYTHYRNEFQHYAASVFDYTAGDPTSKGGGNSVGSYSERQVFNNNLIAELTINYVKSFGDHHFDLLLNGMDQQYNSKYIGMSTEYMTTTLSYLRKLGGENEYTNLGSDNSRHALEGQLARIGYNYKSKYYLDATVRRDGSARFAPNNRWGIFPAVSVAWRISDEFFMQKYAWLTDLKIRAGWGQLGNQEVRDLAYLSAISTNPSYAWGINPSYIGRGNFSTSATVFALANPELQWEKTATTNVGFDALLFSNLNLSLEYYNKFTSGILQEVSLPNSVGVTEQPVSNIAEVRNTGIEVSLNYAQNIGNVRINIGGNFTTVKNTVEKTYKDIPLYNIEEGYSMNYIKGYKVGGIFQSQQEVDDWNSKYTDANYQTAKVAPGDIYFQDLRSAPSSPNEFYSTTPDSIIDSYDLVYLGKTIPGFYYGINLNAEWKGIDIGVQFTGVGDVQKYNDVAANLEYSSGTGNNVSTKVLDSWTPTNISSSTPRVIGGDPAGNFRNSSRFVENAGYIRLANLQIGYTLPEKAYGLAGNSISNLRIYAGASNLFTITNYSGLDPENDKYPTPKVFFMGLSVRF